MMSAVCPVYANQQTSPDTVGRFWATNGRCREANRWHATAECAPKMPQRAEGGGNQYARLCSPKDIIHARVAKAWRATFDNIRDEVRRGWVVQQSYRHAGPGGAAACPSHRRKAPFGSMGVASIAVVNQLVRRLVPREGFHDQATPLMPQDHQDRQQPKAYRPDHKEVYGRNSGHVVPQERLPRLAEPSSRRLATVD
jgi:hypothetical protein